MTCPRALQLASLAISIMFVGVAYAQSQTVLDPYSSGYNDQTAGAIPANGHDYIHLLSETISPSNGSVNLTIGLPVARARGLTVPFSMGYNSSSANQVSANPFPLNINTGTLFSAGWSYGIPNITSRGFTISTPGPDQVPLTCSYVSNFSMTALGGQTHDLYLGAASTQSVPPNTGNPSNVLCQGGSVLNGGDFSGISATLAVGVTPGNVSVQSVDTYDPAGNHYHFSNVGGGPE